MVYIDCEKTEVYMATVEGKSFTLRLPPELYQPIAVMAERERRSIHGQVLYLLGRAVEDFEDIRAADDAKAEDPFGLPLEQARAEIEGERQALRKAS